MQSARLRIYKKAFQSDLDSSFQEEENGKLIVFGMLCHKPNLISQVMNSESELANIQKERKTKIWLFYNLAKWILTDWRENRGVCEKK